MAVIKKKKDSFKTLFDKNLEQFHHVTVILPCPYQLINQLSAEDTHLRFQKIFYVTTVVRIVHRDVIITPTRNLLMGLTKAEKS